MAKASDGKPAEAGSGSTPILKFDETLVTGGGDRRFWGSTLILEPDETLDRKSTAINRRKSLPGLRLRGSPFWGFVRRIADE
jgi:hypothetical protein